MSYEQLQASKSINIPRQICEDGEAKRTFLDKRTE